MADKPENQSQNQPAEQTPETSTEGKRRLPTVDPAKTINYRQDGVDRSKSKK
jgi:hypothetical protein